MGSLLVAGKDKGVKKMNKSMLRRIRKRGKEWREAKGKRKFYVELSPEEINVLNRLVYGVACDEHLNKVLNPRNCPKCKKELQAIYFVATGAISKLKVAYLDKNGEKE